MKKIHCPRCSERLNFLGSEGFRFGRPASEPAVGVEVYSCPKCGKLEFFAAETSGISKVKCECGAVYDCDFPRCPSCGRNNDAVTASK